MKVRELADEDTKQQDKSKSKLAYWFEPHIRVDILSIPLPNLQSKDVLVWKENKSNIFTIKSMYSLVLRMLHPSTGDHSDAAVVRRLWKAVWSLNTPPKVCTFLWRLL